MRNAFVIALLVILLSSIVIAQTTLKGVTESCTSGSQCKSGLCVCTSSDCTSGVCDSTSDSPAATLPACSDGLMPSSGCTCGGISLYGGGCKGGIYYSRSYQSGKSIGESCTDGNQCSNGICFLGVCAHRARCTSQSPGHCNTQTDCLAVSGKWCTYSGGSSSCSSSCPVCSSTYLPACLTQSSCTAAGGYWCSNQCSSAPCPSQQQNTSTSNQTTDLCANVACNSPPNSQCYNSPGTCSAGSCSYSKKPDGTSCDDGNSATTNDKCTGGVCAGSTSTYHGVCLIRDSSTSQPLFSDPDVGKGYAKKEKPGVDTLDGLKTGCTKADYDDLLQKYCAQNSGAVTIGEVVRYPDVSACASIGCSTYYCQYLGKPEPTGGACEIVGSASWGSISYYDPDVGTGYAKKTKEGVNTIAGLETACTKADFDDLLQKYCAQSSGPVYQILIVYGPGGGPASGGGNTPVSGSISCSSVSQPAVSSGACVIRDSYTNMPGYYDSDVGKGYAKKIKNGTNTISGLQTACTKADYDELLTKYCISNSNSVQQQVVTYGSGGGTVSSSCGAFGCDYRSCPSTTTPSSSPAPEPSPSPPSSGGAGGGGGAGGLISTCAKVITPAMDAAGNCKEFSTSCLSPGWNKVDRCPGKTSTCGNGICEAAESSVTCPNDCKGKYVCGNGLCEPDLDESYSNCQQDCQRSDCPVHPTPVCGRGFAMSGALDENGCRGQPTCCGDGACSGAENGYNCRQDCIGAEPDKIQCPDGSYAGCKTDASGFRYCEPCRVPEKILPQGCRQEVEKETGFVKVVCENIQRTCPAFSIPRDAKQSCEQKGGVFNIRKDPNGCEFPDCSFGEISPSSTIISFSTENRCLAESDEQREAKKQECAKLGLSFVISVQGECKISKCVPKAQQSECQPIPSDQLQKTESECKQRGLNIVKYFDESGCTVLKCGEQSQCPRDLPKEAYEKCGQKGGELVIRRNDQGCITLSQCITKTDVRQADVEPIQNIPESSDMLSIAFKMEDMRIDLDKLAKKTEDIANYYGSTNSPDEGRYRRVSNMFAAAKDKVDEIKQKLRDLVKNGITEDGLIEVKRDVRYIKDVMMKDALYMMLSSSKEVDNIKESQAVKIGDKFEEVKATNDTDCGSDSSCFDRAFRLCNKIIFYPEGKKGPKVEIRGLEGDTCIMYAVIQDTGGLPPEITKEIKPPYGMTCKIKNYALGAQNAEKDIFPNCEGPMVELMKKSQQQGEIQGGLSKPVPVVPTAVAAPSSVQTVQAIPVAQPSQTGEQCSGCLSNNICDPGECSFCPDCRQTGTKTV